MAAHDSLPRWRSVLELASTAGVLLASVAVVIVVLFDRQAVVQRRPDSPEPPVPAEPISLEGAALRGDQGAPVVLVVYSDFECPYCGQYAREVQPQIDRQYVQTGRVLLAFRHLPLSVHRRAQKAAEAAECAGKQERFWDMHDALFARQEALDQASLRQRAWTLGLDVERFEKCLQGEMAEKVLAETAAAKTLSITGTPTFFLGARQADGRLKVLGRVRGAQPLVEFQKALDSVLAGHGAER